MRLEYINRVKENDILGRNILAYDGRVLLKAGIKMTNAYIDRLKQLGVYYLYIEDDRLSDVLVEDEKLTELKQATMKNISNIVKKESSNKKEIKQCLNTVENLLEYIVEIGDVNLCLNDIKTYDNYTFLHGMDTGIMATFLGISLNFNEYNLLQLGIGAVLHDIGKTKISRSLINKQGSLTEEEYDEIKKHPIYGEKILRKYASISDIVLDAVLQHHERVDGNGYPFGLKGNEISRFGKIVCVCDVYDALSNNRVYRKKFKENESYELVLAGSGSFFDENIVKNFKNTFSVYPLGSCVRLSNGIEGYVIRQNKGFPDRPVIRVVYDSNSSVKEKIPCYEIDLLNNYDIVVDSVVI